MAYTDLDPRDPRYYGEKLAGEDYAAGNKYFDDLFSSYAKSPDYSGYRKSQAKSQGARALASGLRDAGALTAGLAEGQSKMKPLLDVSANAGAEYAGEAAQIDQQRYGDILKLIQGRFGAAQKGRAFNRSVSNIGQSYIDRIQAMENDVILGQDQLSSQLESQTISGLGNLGSSIIKWKLGQGKT